MGMEWKCKDENSVSASYFWN